MIKLLLLAAALSLLWAPPAWAGHGHGGGGGGGRHRGGARHPAGALRLGVHAGPRRAPPSMRPAPRPRHARVDGGFRPGPAETHAAGVDRRGAPWGRSGPARWRHVERAGAWARGARLPPSYWRGRPWVNWRAHYLWPPPYGHEWAYVDGDYVLVAIGTGVIADIVIAY